MVMSVSGPTGGAAGEAMSELSGAVKRGQYVAGEGSTGAAGAEWKGGGWRQY
jgi:hypothetical protein